MNPTTPDYAKAKKDLGLQDRYRHLSKKKARLRYECMRKRIAYEETVRSYKQVCRELNSVLDELNETFKSDGMSL